MAARHSRWSRQMDRASRLSASPASAAGPFSSRTTSARRTALGNVWSIASPIAETASAEGPRSGQDKAAWITQLFDFLARQDRVSAVVWFQMDKERDWRFNSTNQSQNAFKDAIASRPAP